MFPLPRYSVIMVEGIPRIYGLIDIPSNLIDPTWMAQETVANDLHHLGCEGSKALSSFQILSQVRWGLVSKASAEAEAPVDSLLLLMGQKLVNQLIWSSPNYLRTLLRTKNTPQASTSRKCKSMKNYEELWYGCFYHDMFFSTLLPLPDVFLRKPWWCSSQDTLRGWEPRKHQR